MNDERRLRAAVLKRLSDVSMDMLNCVLLIRYLCAVPDAKQPCTALKHGEGKALWRKLAEAAYTEPGKVRPSIERMMGDIKQDLSFAPELPAPRDTDEETLKALVRELDTLPADGETLSFLFECGQSTVSRPAPTSGDCYTPIQVAQQIAELLEIKRGGSVYDPCCGSGAMLFGAVKTCPDTVLRLYGQTIDAASLPACGINLTLHGLSADLGPRRG
ncbi:N-6 DNA methylase [Gemmiger sp.]